MARLQRVTRGVERTLFLILGLSMGQASADDIEIYTGAGSSTTTYLPNVMFVIDTSGSMSDTDGTSTSRLYKVQEALKQVLSASTDVNVGLMRFSNPGGPVLFPISNIDAAVEPDERVSVRVGGNDGSETGSGLVTLNDTVIGLGNGDLHGFRFEDVRIPQGATIQSAQLYFGSYDNNSDPVTFSIKGELTSDSSSFSGSSNNLSSRSTTTAESVYTESANWVKDQFTPNMDVTDVVQEVVSQSNWCGGQSMSLLVKAIAGAGLGVRRVYANEGNISLSAGLRISYDYASATGCAQGSHANQIARQQDNVEENRSGQNSTGDILNLTTSTNNAIGLRFENVAIPQGATILEAYLKFTPSANQKYNSGFTIQIENSTNSAQYTNSKYTVTGRSYGPSLYWYIAGRTWSNNKAMESPDVSSLISSVTSQGGWASGNAISFKVIPTNTELKAYTFTGGASKAVQLFVRYKGSSGGGATFSVRQYMKTLVDGLTHDGWTPVAETMYEAYRYFNGGEVLYGLNRGISSSTKPLTRVSHSDSYVGADPIRASGCTDENLSASACASEYIPTTPTPVYTSPVLHQCQQNHVVLLTDGRANQTRSQVQSLINQLTGRTCSAESSGDLNDNTCGIDLAYYNAISEKPNGSNDARIFTHTISFVPPNTGSPSWLTYLQDMATQGGGDFYPTTDAASVADAFQRIISEAKKRNTTFVAPSVAISDVNKLLHDSHVYYAVFSPKDTQNWPGNLKKYQVKGGLVLGKNGNQGVDQTTGFFESAEGDFWSSATSGNDEVIVGGAVEQNAALFYRNVYTDIDGLTLIPSKPSVITEDVLGITGRADAASLRDDLLRWLLGLNKAGYADYQMGDPLHSAPVVLKRSGSNDVIFFGTNQGFVHAIDSETGRELYSFIPQELLPNANEFYQNAIFVTRRYGMDGPVTLTRAGGKDILVAGMRRGGESYYALNVSNSTPALIWSQPIKASISGAYRKLGQTWSKMVPAKVNLNGSSKDVLFFGGGYDPTQDNKSDRSADGVGNAVYMVDALTGSLLWYASNADLSDGTTFTQVSGMDYAIPANVYAIDRDRDGYTDHLYAVDMGGQVIRFDIHNGLGGEDFVSGGIIADISANSAEANNRRFFYAPEVAYANDDFGKYFAIAVGSGYRAHPLNEAIQDRFYVLRDYGVFNGESTDVGTKTKIDYTFTKVVESNLIDATNILTQSDFSSLNNADWARYAKGFYIRMTASGEKVLSSPVIADYKVAFTTYIPGDPSANPNVCTPPEGNGRAYVISLSHGKPAIDYVENPNPTASDRYISLTHGGIPSSPKVIYSEQDLPVICVSSECTNASVMFDSDGNPISDSNSQGNEATILNKFLPPTNRVYRDTNWHSSKEVTP